MSIQSNDLLYSVLSIDVYQRTSSSPDFQPPFSVVANTANAITGFGAAAYQVDGKIVIAFRSEDTGSGDQF
jgi:hypothetical protein